MFNYAIQTSWKTSLFYGKIHNVQYYIVTHLIQVLASLNFTEPARNIRVKCYIFQSRETHKNSAEIAFLFSNRVLGIFNLKDLSFVKID